MTSHLSHVMARCATFATLAVAASAQTTFFVREGRPQSGLVVPEDWKSMDGRLVLHGVNRILQAPLALGEGDVQVDVRMTLDALEGTAASFVIDGSHFGFEGRHGKVFLEGSRFEGQTRSLVPASTVITPGVPFTFRVERANARLRFSIDDKVLHEQEDDVPVFGRIGLRPWRSTMRVESWSVRGQLLEDPDVPECVQRHATVFTSGQEGYATFRIPAIVRAKNGDLLAFCEGRVHGAGDAGDIDLVLKRSTDGGRTWGPLQVVAEFGEGTCGNPSPVVLRASGDVVLLCVMQPPKVHEGDIRAGRAGYRTPFVLRSKDHGRTWSKPRSLEDTADRDTWRWYATGPCHAIELQHGEHRGRLVVPANYSSPGGGGNQFLGAHAILSDDAGRTWRIGAVDDQHLGDAAIHPNESTVAELPDGRLLFNARDQHGSSPANRLVTYSLDGGETFVTPYVEERQLVAPVCQAALLSIVRGDESIVVFSAPGHPSKRRTMVLRSSHDGGKTWHTGPPIYRGDAAYSDLVALPDEELGCLHEADGYRRIVFSVVGVTELFEGR